MFNLEYIFFLTGSFFCLYLIFFLKRNFDFLTIYVLILFLYTLPLFFGKVVNPYSGEFINVNPNTLIVMGIVYFITSFFLVRNEYLNPLENSKKIGFEEKIALSFFLILSIFGFILNIPVLFSSGSKTELLENSNLIHTMLYLNMPVAGFLLALKVKNKKYLIIFFLMLLFLMIFGARRSIVIAFLGSVVIFWQGYSFRLIEKYKLIFSSISLLIILILSKTLYGYILFHGLNMGVKSWIENFEVKYFFTGSEFVSTSTILNSVIENSFRTDEIMYFYSFLALQPLPLSYFNYSSSYFNDMFQSTLFPGINYGMAYNPWAEAYSAFGYLGVIVLSICIPCILKLGWYYFNKSKPVFSILILICSLILAFWIERNSLASIFAYVRNIFYPFILIYFFILIFNSLTKGLNNK